uniref:DUF4220 domain-containing protein n=1 Tax=Leersia perrieri TaxID=77586 RepID=A0A0D9W257_9ORYZ
MARGPLDLWNAWATQILVLLSLTLQVVLHVLAGVRRREGNIVERFLLWLAYQLADSTAIYAVGHLSLSSAAREHKLVAFWAPFLLLHLGGPDNITAYSLEDNKLWKRHLVTLVVQVLGVGYVLYKNIAANGTLVVLASILMSIVGTAKYGERTWALWCANFSTIGNSLKVVPRDKHQHFYVQFEHLGLGTGGEEYLLQRAHSLFHICKRGIVDSVIINDEADQDPADKTDRIAISDLLQRHKDHKMMWTTMELELSLMYDIIYTKAYVIHTNLGYIIRTMAPLAVVASLLLFHFSGKGGGRIDIAITYVLLGGALVLETRSLLDSLGSTWTLVFLCTTPWSWLRHVTLCSGRWQRFRRVLHSLSWPARILMPRSSRRWSRRIGQYNMLYSCTGEITTTTAATSNQQWLKNLSTMVGFTDWWDMKCTSSTITIPEKVLASLQDMHENFEPYDLNTMGLLRHNWGDLAMGKNRGKKTRPMLFKRLENYHGVDFHESILIWHIATDLILAKIEQDGSSRSVDLEAIRAMSDYMMFVFVDHLDMLPGLPHNLLFQKTKINIAKSCKTSDGVFHQLWHGARKSYRLMQTNKLARIILELPEEDVKPGPRTPRLSYARTIAARLSDWKDEDPVDVLHDMWIDFLMYAANRCNRESHAKKLNKGGEFLTIVWLMIEHFQQLAKAHKKHSNV